MKTIFSHYTLVLILGIFGLSTQLHAQEVMTVGEDDSTEVSNNLLVEAQVLVGAKPFEGVEVGIETQNGLRRLDNTDSSGFFSIELEFDSLYTLLFIKTGYITKKIQIDTRNMPEEDKEFGYDLGLFKLSMLDAEEAGEYSALYMEPVARFKYSEVAQIFVYDKAYKKQVKKRFDKEEQKPDIIKF